MRREVMWSGWDQPWLEHVSLRFATGGLVADSLVLGLLNEQAIRARYLVRCDADWRVREVEIALIGGDERSLHLLSDGRGTWTDGDGDPLSQLSGCLDVDIMATPFTNTLPIRRLDWLAGDAAEIDVAYIAFPSIEVGPVRQRYTCLEALTSSGGRFRYESLTSGFRVDLPVDSDGLVLDYPGIWRRVWPEPDDASEAPYQPEL